MQRTKDNYHVKIYRKFLFEFKKQFASEYTRWVYVYLKLINNYKIQHKMNDCYAIDATEIASFFNINRATVYECLKDLDRFLLLSRKGKNKYLLESEETLMNLYYEANNLEGVLKEEKFVPIHKNLFIDLFNNGCGVREAEVYYYLISQNKHYVIKDPFLEVNVKNNKICSDLKTDHRTLKRIISKLLNAGRLIKDENHKLRTKSPRPGFENCIYKPLEVKEENITLEQPLGYEYDTNRIFSASINPETAYYEQNY